MKILAPDYPTPSNNLLNSLFIAGCIFNKGLAVPIYKSCVSLSLVCSGSPSAGDDGWQSYVSNMSAT
eukprot:5479839-Pleurochrysis_carterae.AAC.1